MIQIQLWHGRNHHQSSKGIIPITLPQISQSYTTASSTPHNHSSTLSSRAGRAGAPTNAVVSSSSPPNVYVCVPPSPRTTKERHRQRRPRAPEAQAAHESEAPQPQRPLLGPLVGRRGEAVPRIVLEWRETRGGPRVVRRKMNGAAAAQGSDHRVAGPPWYGRWEMIDGPGREGETVVGVVVKLGAGGVVRVNGV